MIEDKLCKKCNTRNRFPSGRCRTCRLIYLEDNKQLIKQKRLENKDDIATYMHDYYMKNKLTNL